MRTSAEQAPAPSRRPMVSWAMRAASTSPAASAVEPELPAAPGALVGEVDDAGRVGSRRAEQALDGLVGDARRLDVTRGERGASRGYPPRRVRSTARSMTLAASAPGAPSRRPMVSWAMRAASTSPAASASLIPSASWRSSTVRGSSGFVRDSSGSRGSAHLAAAVCLVTSPPACGTRRDSCGSRRVSRVRIPLGTQS